MVSRLVVAVAEEF